MTGGWSEEIPDDIQLFPEESQKDEADPEPKEPVAAKPAAAKPPAKKAAPAPAPAPDVEEKPPVAEAPEPPPATPKSLQQMMTDIEERDRQVGERERAYRDADQWRKKAEEHDRLMEEIRSDPVKALQRAGGDVTRMFEEKLGLTEPQSVEEKLHARLEALEKERAEERQRSQTQAQVDRMAAAQRGIQARHEQFIEHHAAIPLENNPLAHVAAFKTHGKGTMWAKAEAYATRTGRWLPDEEAARQAEEQLASEVEMVLDIASKMPQYQGRFVGEGQTAAPAESRRTPPGKTTSNRDTTTPPPAKRQDDSLIGASDDEVLAAGLAAYAETARKK